MSYLKDNELVYSQPDPTKQWASEDRCYLERTGKEKPKMYHIDACHALECYGYLNFCRHRHEYSPFRRQVLEKQLKSYPFTYAIEQLNYMKKANRLFGEVDFSYKVVHNIDIYAAGSTDVFNYFLPPSKKLTSFKSDSSADWWKKYAKCDKKSVQWFEEDMKSIKTISMGYSPDIDKNDDNSELKGGGYEEDWKLNGQWWKTAIDGGNILLYNYKQGDTTHEEGYENKAYWFTVKATGHFRCWNGGEDYKDYIDEYGHDTVVNPYLALNRVSAIGLLFFQKEKNIDGEYTNEYKYSFVRIPCDVEPHSFKVTIPFNKIQDAMNSGLSTYGFTKSETVDTSTNNFQRLQVTWTTAGFFVDAKHLHYDLSN